ncbi:MAG: hypothetical protein HY842_02625 [Bacteroidetes bacterium]|nr:hypothetical protein [Bacteroidota bacterium]
MSEKKTAERKFYINGIDALRRFKIFALLFQPSWQAVVLASGETDIQ